MLRKLRLDRDRHDRHYVLKVTVDVLFSFKLTTFLSFILRVLTIQITGWEMNISALLDSEHSLLIMHVPRLSFSISINWC